MSTKHVHEFWERLAADESYRSDVAAALQERPDVSEAVVSVARDAGFEFTAEEYASATAQRSGDRELGDGELDAVAGGMSLAGGAGSMLAFPDVCKMPGPPAPFVPIPLPNTGQSPGGTASKGKTGRRR